MNKRRYFNQPTRGNHLCLASLGVFCRWLTVAYASMRLSASDRIRLKAATPAIRNFKERALSMKMNVRNIAYALLVPVVTLTACIRDEIEDCPPLQINIAVKDKNYFNVDKVDLEQRKNDNLAFREYVPSIYYVLRDFNTGEIVEESGLTEIRSDDKILSIGLCPCIPHGKYILTVWGGMSNLDAIGDDGLSLDLNPDNFEGEDIYMTNDTILYDAWHNNQTVELERTKGKLIIEKILDSYSNNIELSKKTVSALFSGVDNNFKYTTQTTVMSERHWNTTKYLVTKTVLSPSVKEKGSSLHIDFFNSSNSIDHNLKPKDVRISMRRNELTVLRYVWNQDKKDFDIYLLINDNWELVHGMEID